MRGRCRSPEIQKGALTAQNRAEAPSPSLAALARPLPARRGEVRACVHPRSPGLSLTGRAGVWSLPGRAREASDRRIRSAIACSVSERGG
jgi:hypothetical protein